MDKNTIIAFTRLAAMAITGCAAMFGFAIDTDLACNMATVALFITAMLWGWWKNNNVTDAAKEAQEILGMIKNMDGYSLDPVEFEDDEDYEDGEDDDDEYEEVF